MEPFAEPFAELVQRELPLSVGQAFAFQASLDQIRALAFAPQLFTGRFNPEGLFDGAKSEAAGEAIVKNFQMVVFEFEHFSTIDTDEMIVTGAIEKVGIIGRLPVTQIDLMEEVSLGQERQSSIERCPRGGGTLFAKAFKELFGSKVLVRRKNELDDGIALRGLA